MADEKKQEYALPLPRAREFASDFYKFCHQHELRFQRCLKCGTWRHVPRDMCARCGSFEWEWAKSSGRGKLFSWTTVFQPMLPLFAASVPYSPAIVELDEGVRMVSWIVDVKPEELELGMAVKVVFENVGPDVALAKFRRA
jgi:uncharacterized OB-fold protein